MVKAADDGVRNTLEYDIRNLDALDALAAKGDSHLLADGVVEQGPNLALVAGYRRRPPAW